MKTLGDIHSEWAKDSKIDRDQIDVEAIQIPKLHAKYLKHLSVFRLNLKRKIEKKKQLEETLTDYFSGKIDGKDIGRGPWQLHETKGQIEKRVAADKEIIDTNLSIAEEEEKVKVLIDILQNINQRNFQLKVAVDYLRWSQGG